MKIFALRMPGLRPPSPRHPRKAIEPGPRSDNHDSPPNAGLYTPACNLSFENVESLIPRFAKIIASLRFVGEDLDPDVITREMGCSPTRQYRNGDPVTRDGRGVRPSGLWRLESTVDESAALEEHISDILRRLPTDLAIWRKLQAYQPEIIVGLFPEWFNEGGELSSDMLGRLSERGISLSLDVYSATPQSTDEPEAR